ISGKNFAKLLEKHILIAGVTIKYDHIGKIHYENDTFILNGINRKYRAPFLILATGTIPRKIDLPGNLSETDKAKVFYEVTELLDFEGKSIAIVGGGDAAFDYALNLCMKNEVSINIRANVARALDLLQERADAEPAIQVYHNRKLISVSSNGKGLIFTWEAPDGIIEQKADFLLFAIGRDPREILLNQLPLDIRNSLLDRGKLHIIGDLINGNYRQIAIATGQGIEAAMKINSLLKKAP
ncbi:NAD(P)/FAD-dependent oxidoreductase, partial [bacterium]|nr:NAD(P)/FAD-dependent oxidoreductase [bacterium]